MMPLSGGGPQNKKHSFAGIKESGSQRPVFHGKKHLLRRLLFSLLSYEKTAFRFLQTPSDLFPGWTILKDSAVEEARRRSLHDLFSAERSIRYVTSYVHLCVVRKLPVDPLSLRLASSTAFTLSLVISSVQTHEP